MLRPDPSDSVRFLRSVRPSGFWVLVAIQPDGAAGDIETRSFAAGEGTQAADWIERWNQAGRNVYWTVNATARPLAKKPSREDIAAMEYLHVDVDPDKQKPLPEERARLQRLFGEEFPATVPRPSVIVDSGGGIQAFWRLSRPVRIDGRPELYEEAKRYNQQLEITFGADSCHNVDRIMRLPGTINWPDERKRSAGRVPRMAVVLSSDPAHALPLSKFAAAPRVQIGDGGLSDLETRPVVDTGNVRRLRSLDELDVPDFLKVVINVGKDPDDPKRWPSRSEPLFYVVCELLRREVPDEVIYSIITDPDFGISESVREKGARAERYALQQIEHAREHCSDPLLSEMNRRHAVIGDLGGKCRVLSESFDEFLGRPHVSYATFEDIRNRYSNRTPEQPDAEKKKLRTLGDWWLSHPRRRYYERVLFAPGQDPPGCYNLWRGFACEARPGDCSLYLRHVRENICRGDERLYGYVTSWMARAVQMPGEPGQVALVMRGERGVGKGEFTKHFGSLFGRHFMPCTNPIHLVGQFNLHLRDTVVLFADEAFYAGDKRHEAVLKGLVTEELLTLEGKFLGTESGRNCLHIIMATNSDWVVPAGRHERRFLVLDVSSDKLQDGTFFGPLNEQMRAGGREALLHYLLSLDIASFNPRVVPGTEALQEQKEHSLSPEEEWWHSKLYSGEAAPGRGWPEWLTCEELALDFQSYVLGWGRGQRCSRVRLTKLLERAGCRRGQLGRRVDSVGPDGRIRSVDRPRVYMLPSIERARQRWNELFGGSFNWGGQLETVQEMRTDDHF
jgi:hypothetical protein